MREPLGFIAKQLVILAGMLLLAGGVPTQELPKYLEASLKHGEFGEAPCAGVTGNLRPEQSGFTDIRDELIPGAHRIVIANQRSGWRMVWGVPDLLVLTAYRYF